ncbi:DUF188 domain-containing protein [Desulfuribacillus alkaliarsenatis]|uniref:Uncharacterized protein n=1 Tax=Desulfuribacillus alkaliarsenatis TaxID=766136 RepID=A0A1E5G051_9FIRM|nr:DUF188 domain-containing protein [Desulfuribacillus alkaliarsenatis]OEF96211.1 hypothetical protein BHF68_08575 [Desulfuribacillus alkaliarsenatis]
MKILVDADTCPVSDEIMRVSQLYKINTYFVATTNRLFLITGESIYYQWHFVDQSKYSTDIFIANNIDKGDIIITQNYQLAMLALAKKGIVMTYRGRIIESDNIDFLLYKRNVYPKTSQSKRPIISQQMDVEDRILFKNKLIELINSL